MPKCCQCGITFALNLSGPMSRKYSSPFKQPISKLEVNQGGFTLGSSPRKLGSRHPLMDLTFGLKIASSNGEYFLVLGPTRFGGNMMPH